MANGSAHWRGYRAESMARESDAALDSPVSDSASSGASFGGELRYPSLSRVHRFFTPNCSLPGCWSPGRK